MKEDGQLVKPLIVLHPGARYWFKSWPAERFAELADGLAHAHKCQILLGGGSQDVPMVTAICEQMQSSPLVLSWDYSGHPIHWSGDREGITQRSCTNTLIAGDVSTPRAFEKKITVCVRSPSQKCFHIVIL